MPPEALHSAIVTPSRSAVSEAPDERVAAVLTASPNTAAAPGGSAVCRPFTRCCTALVPRCIKLARPSRAIGAGNSARNQ